MTQAALAKAIGSSQARVAKMEGGDPQALVGTMSHVIAAVLPHPAEGRFT